MNELLFIGIFASLLYAEATGLSPGGLITPAYFLLHFSSPPQMLTTLLLSLLSMAVIRFLSRYMILYGRRRLALYLLCGMALKAAFSLLFAGGSILWLPNLSASIGYIVPGLIGRDAEKQGILRTLLSLMIVVLLLRVAQLAFLR